MISTFPDPASALSQTFAGVNTGVVTTTTASMYIGNRKTLSVQVVQASGTITAAVTTVETSNDNTNWNTTASTIAAAALTDNISIGTQYVRLKVTTQSAIASTANITVVAK